MFIHLSVKIRAENPLVSHKNIKYNKPDRPVISK